MFVAEDANDEYLGGGFLMFRQGEQHSAIFDIHSRDEAALPQVAPALLSAIEVEATLGGASALAPHGAIAEGDAKQALLEEYGFASTVAW